MSSAATSYEYCLDITNNNICDGSWVSLGGATSVTASLTAGQTTYYWQVRARNAAGTTEANGLAGWWNFRPGLCCNEFAEADFVSSFNDVTLANAGYVGDVELADRTRASVATTRPPDEQQLLGPRSDVTEALLATVHQAKFRETVKMVTSRFARSRLSPAAVTDRRQ